MEKLDFSSGVSIIIPSWDNAEYLFLCINSIMQNSRFKHEIIVHLNEYVPHVASELSNNGIKFTVSSENVGVCKALNFAAKLSTKNIIGYFNDDMVALPDWDGELNNFCIKNNCDEHFILASTMIEPTDNNPCCIAPCDFGRNVEEFKSKYQSLIKILDELKQNRYNVSGTTWPPNFMHKNLWNKVGGYSEEYNVGFGSDPDLIKKCYDIGCRNFIGVGRSLVYHFQCKTTKKVGHLGIDSDSLFFKKHGISISNFCNNIIRRGSRL